MKYKLLNQEKNYLIVLGSGAEVIQSIQAFAEEHQLESSQFNAIGTFSKATIGFFDFGQTNYKKIEIDEQVDVLNITGDIS